MYQAEKTIENKLLAILSTALFTALAVFVLTFAAKVGSDLVKVLQPIPVEAAPGESTAQPTSIPATPTAAPVKVTLVSPTSAPLVESTAVPTNSPAPTSTSMPTPEIQDPYLIVGESGVNVRTGPGLDYDKIGMLMPLAKASIVGYNGEWWAVDINGEQGWVYAEIVTAHYIDDVIELAAPLLPTPEPTETPKAEETLVPVWIIDEDRWVDVDLSEQRLTAYEMQTPVKSYLVSTGLPQTPTPVGQFRIWIKLRTDDMAGADYYIKDVPWVMYFFEGYGLHGVTWHANFGHQMSHGCVNQPNDMAEWLFNFASMGTLVNIHE